MKVLTTSTDNQSVKFIPRQEVTSGKILLTNKDTRDVLEVIPTFQTLSNQTELTASFNLTEGSRYTLTIVSNDVVVYRDTVICTDQTDYDKYNAQKGEYVQANTNDNKYVIRD